MGFKENLKSELEYQGLKTQELSDKSGVKKRTIDHYLISNPQEPSVTNAFKIAQALNVSVEYLVTGSEIRENTPLTKELIDFLGGITESMMLFLRGQRVILKTTQICTSF